MEERSVFYKEWLPLPKEEFNILMVLATEGGSFSGNYSDICRYLGVTPQNRNRRTIQAAIDALTSANFIYHKSCGRTQVLTVIPKAKEVLLPRSWVQSVIRHDYSSESVAPAQLLKVFIWIDQNEMSIVTNEMIAADLKVSPSTVVSAKNVLLREYETITGRKVSEKLSDNTFRTLGQELKTSAWWTEI